MLEIILYFIIAKKLNILILRCLYICIYIYIIINMDNAYKRWSNKEELTLLEELNDNLTINEISLNHKRSQGAINSRIKLLTYKIKDDILIEKKNKIKIPNNMDNAYKRWSNKEELTLLEELNDNLTINQISLNHKRSQGAIKSRIKLLTYKMKDGISVVEICNKNKLDANSLDILIEKNKIKTPNNIEIYQKLLEVEKKLNVLLSLIS